ncbi:nucleolar and coiled-body phosphoprotein 1-like [Xyrauchen texanus]|uniref:nucleolar and coiled-body phosphoprotein 1-like n=1 Tax=Xyrauchen texanus TaxID=154827 RepID=UPI002242159B|nr:nucleolar and coiled-body phosphoprotein 1-like [Xyrauchen texanus]
MRKKKPPRIRQSPHPHHRLFPKSNRRIKDDEIDVDPRLADNSFDAKLGASGDWGQKANNVLRFTKGKSFRHEKTKKKRGSYRGGAISTSVNSIRFDSE